MWLWLVEEEWTECLGLQHPASEMDRKNLETVLRKNYKDRRRNNRWKEKASGEEIEGTDTKGGRWDVSIRCVPVGFS